MSDYEWIENELNKIRMDWDHYNSFEYEFYVWEQNNRLVEERNLKIDYLLNL